MAHYNAASQLLDSNIAAGRSANTAFIDTRRSISYADLAADTRRLARLLVSLGIRREERAVMVMQDTIAFPTVFLGAIRAGIVPAPLNTMLAAEHYAYILEDSRARVLFVSAALLPVIEPVLAQTPGIEHVIVTDGPAGPGRIDFAKALAAQPAEFETAQTHPDETAFWLYSSGSTGMPKGTRHIHTSLMETARLYGAGVLGMKEGDRCLSAAKLFFAYGLGNSLTFPMSVGATSILHADRPTPHALFDLMKQHQPTLFFGVPTLYAAMLADAELTPARGSAALRLCASAGEALPAHIARGWRERFGLDLIDGVGSTELLHIFLSNRPGDVGYGTAGRAVPGYEVRLVDEKGAPVPDGEVGEMLVSGPTAADGYWNQRAKSRATFEGGWTRTGDKYTRDADGRYICCGRSDDMFKVSGIWVSPFEVEAALASHPLVLEAGVVPAEDSDGLLKPKAYIVLKAGERPADLDALLKAHVKERIGMWKYPRWIVVLDALPKTAVGKIQRFKLRDM